MKYRKINNIVGWITGAIAYIVYLKTMEPTASYWDCGEFLSCAYKLEVGHSPGAPFFMLVQRLFGIFAPSPDKAAMFINSLSVLTSALSILFLFWTITHMAKKMVAKGTEEPSLDQSLIIMGAGLVGALAYTFSDTFWFSAVEAEVYGTSSFFTAISFWAILKWEDVADKKYADRWIVLIAYLIGISVGVHLLNLLTIPALAMVYYFKRYQSSLLGGIAAFVIGCVILAFVQFGVIQYIPIFASKFDILFTNDFGLPFDTGSLTFIIIFLAFLVWLLMFAKRKGMYLLHISVLSVLFIIIGYSSYVVPVIRSRADTPIDMTNPDNALNLQSYVSREQFGEQPLLYGQDFSSPVINYKKTGDMYNQTKKNGKDYYEVVGKKMAPEYDPSSLRFFPRMYEGGEAQHAQFYRSFCGLAKDETPSSADNMKYFFGYQMNWMWWRYFMWNYAGRQNDMEGQGDPKNGNWISGIKVIDKMHGLGDTDLMADGYKNNGARNELYFLPLILGILGLVYQFMNDKKNGIVTLVLFFFTGAAIGIYLNMPPLQPRERDYAFAGCTYAFAIWIGLGVLMVNDWFQKAVKGKTAIYATILLCLLAVPTLMAAKEWDDHDRSRKTLPRATAFNTLMSCAPNAILFTYGDNDTYPLWYLQEVEGLRKDVRIINTSLLSIDWYVDQLNYRINDADAVPMIWKKEDYIGDRHNYIRYNKNARVPQDKYFNLEEICNFIISKDPSAQAADYSGELANYFPSKKFFVNTPNKAELVQNGLAEPKDTARINTEMKFTFPKDLAYKSDITILNIVAAVAKQGWIRPLYFDSGLPAGNYGGMSNNMKLEGLVYRLMPYSYYDSLKTSKADMGTIDLDKTYKLFTETYIWGGADRKDVYFDEKNRIMFSLYRINAASTANGLVAEGRKAEAIKLLDKVMQGISEHSFAYDYTAYFIASAYYNAGAVEKGRDLANKVAKNAADDLNWISTLSDDGKQSMATNGNGGDIMQDIRIIGSLGREIQMAGDTVTGNKLSVQAQAFYDKFKSALNTGASAQ